MRARRSGPKLSLTRLKVPRLESKVQLKPPADEPSGNEDIWLPIAWLNERWLQRACNLFFVRELPEEFRWDHTADALRKILALSMTLFT